VGKTTETVINDFLESN